MMLRLILWLGLISILIACTALTTAGPGTTGGDDMAGMDHNQDSTSDDMAAMESTTNELAALNGAEFEIAFLDAMIPHHQSAIDMAQIALERGQREEIKTLAQAIITAQEAEIDQMTTWLNDWHGRAPSGEDHGMTMADATENLRTMAAEEFDLAFVNAMIPHHETAVQMAELVAERTARAELQTMATDIITSQQAEIDQMNQWATAWGDKVSRQ